MFSASLFINQALGWNIYFGILLQLALTALCTALGNVLIVNPLSGNSLPSIIWC
jgi:hypothetical protein